MSREEEMGAGLRFRGDGRIGDGELRARIDRLKDDLEQLAEVTWATATPGAKAAAKAISLARSALDRLGPDRFAEAQIEAALRLCRDLLDDAAEALTTAFEQEAEALDPALRLANTAEIEALAEDDPDSDREPWPLDDARRGDDPAARAEHDDAGGDGGGAPAEGEPWRSAGTEAPIRLAALCEVAEGAREALAEARTIHVGRVGRAAGRRRPERERGRRLVAQLPGFAEALGLIRYAHADSAIDAVILALERLRAETPGGPGRTLLDETPLTREAIERRLIRDIPGDPILAAAHEDGARIAALRVLGG